jgi:hypothetical protein
MLGKPIQNYVIKQITTRQSTQGSGISSNRTPQQISVLNSPTSWVKLASGASVTSNRLTEAKLSSNNIGTNLAKNYVLFGGTSRVNGNKLSQREEPFSKDGIYTMDNTVAGLEFGLSPMPGIESIDVQHINNGSIRKATVTIKAYNKAQLDALDILYMRLGYTMLLEWGNSTYTNNNGAYQTMGPTLVESGFLENSLPNSTSTEILQKINSYRTSYDGNYDAIYGRISNFNWSFSEDGSYSIVLNILSLGDIFESLKINIPASPQELKFSTEASIILTETKPEVTGSYLGQPEGIELESSNDSSPTKDKLSTYLFNSKICFANQKVTAPEDIDFKINGTPIKIGSFVKPSPTITLTPSGSGTPATLNNEASSIQTPKDIAYFFYSNGEAPNSVIPEDLGYYMRFGHLLEYVKEFLIPKVKNAGGKKFPLIELDTTTDNKMYYFPNQISLDPSVCVVNSIFRKITLFDTLSPWIGNGYANIMNIYVSFEQIHSSLESNLDEENRVNLYGFLSSICDSLNASLGGVNNLQPIVDEDTNTIKIIDQNYNSNPQPNDKLILYGYEGNNSTFVRNVSLKTSLTPELTATIAVGATSDGYSQGIENTMFAKWNKNIKNRFQPKIVTPDPKTNPNDPVQNYINNFYAKGKLALGYKYDGSENPPELDKDSIGNNISIATEFYKYAQAYLHSINPEYGSPTQGFIPINLGITMNGISGVKIFNSLSVDTSFLPNNYPKSLRFITKAINHKISNQDWETTLETLVIPETHKGASLILSFPSILGQIETLLGANGILSVVLDETTGNINTPSWLTERFAALRVAPGGGGGNINLGGGENAYWIYASWNQGPAGAASLWNLAKGRADKFISAQPATNIASNWPGGYVASDGTSVKDVSTLHSSNPRKLANAFIEIQQKLYKEVKEPEALALINSNGKNRTGLAFSTMKAAFEKIATEKANPNIGFANLVTFGYVENGLHTDTQTNNSFASMFQMNSTYTSNPDFASILNKYKVGSPEYRNHKTYPGAGTYQTYGDNDFVGYVRDVFPHIVASFDSFVQISGYPN